MIPRRALLGVAISPFAPAALAAPPDLAFKVLREGREVGTHIVRFRDEGGLLRARSEVRIAVTLAGFTVFRYSNDTDEAWRGDRLVALTSRLERNGRAMGCEARAEGGTIRLRGTAGDAVLPANAAPLTWWRAAAFAPGVPLFDPRDGKPVQPELRRRTENGGQRITLIGGEGAEIIYDGGGAWIGFATTGEDGSTVTYRRA
jgi:hypothetical protein